MSDLPIYDAAETARIYGTMLDHAMDGIDRRDALLAAMTAERDGTHRANVRMFAENVALRREIQYLRIELAEERGR